MLAFALGPLETADLLALMKHIHETQGMMAADRLLEPLRRFVFGNGKRGSGYAKIGEYLQEERFAASKDVLCDLNEGKIKPEQASSYVLQYLPEHFEKVGAYPQDYMMMVVVASPGKSLRVGSAASQAPTKRRGIASAGTEST